MSEMAVKTLSMPSVTMNGGSLIRVTRSPLTTWRSDRDRRADQQREHPRHVLLVGQLRHDQRGQHHDRADRQVDAGGQDDQGLPGRERADDGDLLDHQGQVLQLVEVAAGQAESHAGEDQDDGRAEGGLAVQHGMDALAQARRAVEELLKGRGGGTVI